MKEIGKGEKAFLFCTDVYCELNNDQALQMPAEEALKKGRDHDAPEAEAVVVRFDRKNPLSKEDKLKVLSLTGMHLG